MIKRKIDPNGYKIVVFDCDSTLSAVEGIDLLAEKYGVKKEVEKITHLAMNGHNNFAEALALRLKLVRPFKDDLIWLGHKYIQKTVPGTRRLISQLKRDRKEVYIISGGFKTAIEIFAQYLGVDKSHVFTNELLFDKKQRFVGFDIRNPLAHNHGKQIVLKKIARKGPTVFVGDGATDLEAKSAADLFIGFGGIKVRDIVKKNSDIFIESKTLTAVRSIALGNSEIF